MEKQLQNITSLLHGKGKFKAFTILELLTGMIVSSIVLGATFTAYEIISKQAESYRKHSESYTQRSQLHSVLTRDVLQSDSISLLDDRHTSIQISSKSILYESADSFILRTTDTHTDTFRVYKSLPEEYFLPHERDQHQP